MLNPSIGKLIGIYESRYQLVLDVAKYARYISEQADEKGEIAQKTEDLVGPYELHDFFIYNFVYYNFTPKKIYRLAKIAFDGVYSDEVIKKWLSVFARRFVNNQFKRSCMPDGPMVNEVSLSPRGALRLPSDAAAAVLLKEIESL